jgi:hypothetical protein
MISYRQPNVNLKIALRFSIGKISPAHAEGKKRQARSEGLWLDENADQKDLG